MTKLRLMTGILVVMSLRKHRKSTPEGIAVLYAKAERIMMDRPIRLVHDDHNWANVFGGVRRIRDWRKHRAMPSSRVAYAAHTLRWRK